MTFASATTSAVWRSRSSAGRRHSRSKARTRVPRCCHETVVAVIQPMRRNMFLIMVGAFPFGPEANRDREA